ncbi:MAG: hypothetical protein KAJ07_08520 [Planctomycetes bacterium]|nr:hypothetical protein [Planctomycetota bacterium]
MSDRNFLAEIADEIGEALINNPQLKSSMIEHTEKVIQKAEEYGQYLRSEWQKAKDAGLTQYDENKDGEGWFWWTSYMKGFMWGKGVYFASDEGLDVHFYMNEKPKPSPLSYLSSMIYGSIGEDYNGLELLDYQFILLAIIHDAQNWQAGRKRIYFDPLREEILSDRLCRAVWQHLESKIATFNYREVRKTITSALQTIKAQHIGREEKPTETESEAKSNTPFVKAGGNISAGGDIIVGNNNINESNLLAEKKKSIWKKIERVALILSIIVAVIVIAGAIGFSSCNKRTQNEEALSEPIIQQTMTDSPGGTQVAGDIYIDKTENDRKI